MDKEATLNTVAHGEPAFIPSNLRRGWQEPDGRIVIDPLSHTSQASPVFVKTGSLVANPTPLDRTNDRYQILAYLNQSFSDPVGKTANVGGPFDKSGQQDLN